MQGQIFETEPSQQMFMSAVQEFSNSSASISVLNSSRPSPDPMAHRSLSANPFVVATFHDRTYALTQSSSFPAKDKTESKAGPYGVSMSSQSPNESPSSSSQHKSLSPPPPPPIPNIPPPLSVLKEVPQ
jgi:hypothetical protein